MNDYFLERKIVIATLLLSIAGLIGYVAIMLFVDHGFTVEVIMGIVKPLGALALIMVFFSVFFLFFPETIFKSWLKKIAWWYGLGLFVVTASTPVYSSNVLSVDRSQVVFGGMSVLAIITILFVFISRRRLK